jgi:hypothetical protein
MIELGEKRTLGPEVSTSQEKNKNVIDYPYLDINKKDIGVDPEDVGKTITATVKLKVKTVTKGISVQDGEKVENNNRVSFDVLAIGIDKKDFADAVEAGIKK